MLNYYTKYKKSAIASIESDQNQSLPSYVKITEIFVIHAFLYLKLLFLKLLGIEILVNRTN